MSSSSITLRFIHNDDNWRVMCEPSSGRCFIWRNGSFMRSATYVPGQGLRDHDGLVGEVVPTLLDRLMPHDAAMESFQRMAGP